MRFEVPWGAVQGISAGRVRMDNEVWHLALAADIDREWSARLVIVTEADRIWARFTQVLPQVFPCVPSVTMWGPQALTTPEPISLYDRPSRDSIRWVPKRACSRRVCLFLQPIRRFSFVNDKAIGS
ncbi:hypothetical protein ACFSHP_26710 [Novosphingobium panipatense]